jgi:hypothetical protein
MLELLGLLAWLHGSVTGLGSALLCFIENVFSLLE